MPDDFEERFRKTDECFDRIEARFDHIEALLLRIAARIDQLALGRIAVLATRDIARKLGA